MQLVNKGQERSCIGLPMLGGYRTNMKTGQLSTNKEWAIRWQHPIPSDSLQNNRDSANGRTVADVTFGGRLHLSWWKLLWKSQFNTSETWNSQPARGEIGRAHV